MRFLISVVLLTSPSIALAQQNCAAPLIQDKTDFNSSSATDLALIKLIDKKHSSSKSTDGNGNVAIAGISMGGSYNQAQASADSYFENTNLTYTDQRLISLATQSLSENAVRAYTACIENADVAGPQIFVHNATRTQATITVRWISPPGAPTYTAGQVDVTGGEFQQPFPSEWRTGQSESRVVTRTPGQDIRLTANIGDDSDQKFVAWIPAISITKEQREVVWRNGGSLWRVANDGLGNNQRIQQCRAADRPWKIVPASISINVAVRAGNIDNTSYAKITSSSPDRVCFDAFIRPLSREGGGDIQFDVRYQLEKVEVTES